MYGHPLDAWAGWSVVVNICALAVLVAALLYVDPLLTLIVLPGEAGPTRTAGRNASCAPSRESRRTLLSGHYGWRASPPALSLVDPRSARFLRGEPKNSALCELFTRDLRCDVCNVRARAC